MRAVTQVAYIVMAVWLIIAAVVRAVLLIVQGFPLDLLPFVSFGLGAGALVFLGVASARVRARRGGASGAGRLSR